jgi:hypothetical protein
VITTRLGRGESYVDVIFAAHERSTVYPSLFVCSPYTLTHLLRLGCLGPRLYPTFSALRLTLSSDLSLSREYSRANIVSPTVRVRSPQTFFDGDIIMNYMPTLRDTLRSPYLHQAPHPGILAPPERHIHAEARLLALGKVAHPPELDRGVAQRMAQPDASHDQLRECGEGVEQ